MREKSKCPFWCLLPSSSREMMCDMDYASPCPCPGRWAGFGFAVRLLGVSLVVDASSGSSQEDKRMPSGLRYTVSSTIGDARRSRARLQSRGRRRYPEPNPRMSGLEPLVARNRSDRTQRGVDGDPWKYHKGPRTPLPCKADLRSVLVMCGGCAPVGCRTGMPVSCH